MEQQLKPILTLRLCMCASIALATSAITAWAANPHIVERIDVIKDSSGLQRIHCILTFNQPPSSFPVYAMANPNRIILDLTNTTVKKEILPVDAAFSVIDRIDISEQTFQDEPNTRVQIFLKQGIHYTAHLSGKQIVLVLNLAGEVKQSLQLFRSDSSRSEITSVRSIDLTSLEKGFEIEIAFTALPRAASVYKLDAPPRIVMDFYEVFIKNGLEKAVNITPVKNISVIKRDDDPPYAGMVVYLSKDAPFHYRQIGDRMVVGIPWTGGKISRKSTFMMIGAGVLVAGGVVTGILLGGEGGEAPPVQPDQGDLGTPPSLPPY